MASIMTDNTGEKNGLIGGQVCHLQVPATLIDPEDNLLTFREREKLWGIFIEIGQAWENMGDKSANVKSSWLEFIHAKTAQQPSYVGEYANAIAVVQELETMYGREQAFQKLFFDSGIPDGPPTTRLAHAKVYVINEFIRMQVVAGGFKGFVKPTALNYKGYVGGSRYNLESRVRDYEPANR
jgi:hypothetical protein